MSEEFNLADSVLMRLVQIFQEGMVMGIDVSDLMRQIRLVKDDANPSQLVLSPAYIAMVQEHYTKLIKQAEELKAARDAQKLVFDPNKGSSGEPS